MGVQRLNHAVLYVSDVARSTAFYTEVLEFVALTARPGIAFLRAAGSTNDHDLGLFEARLGPDSSDVERSSVGLYHLAWEVDTLSELDRLAVKLSNAGALVGASDHGTTKSLYAKDPDGIEFEICWLVPADQLGKVSPGAATQPLNLEQEKGRFGAGTLGGVGISTPNAV